MIPWTVRRCDISLASAEAWRRDDIRQDRSLNRASLFDHTLSHFISHLSLKDKEQHMNIYVGNLSWSTEEDGLRQAFEEFGAVDSVAIIKDRETGRSRGFGFVEMSNDAEAQAAMNALNGADIDSRTLVVNEARPREKRSGGGGGSRKSYQRRGSGGGGGYNDSW